MAGAANRPGHPSPMLSSPNKQKRRQRQRGRMLTLGRIGKPVVRRAIADTGRSLFARQRQMAANSCHSLCQADPAPSEIGLGQRIAAAAHDDPQHAVHDRGLGEGRS